MKPSKRIGIAAALAMIMLASCGETGIVSVDTGGGTDTEADGWDVGSDGVCFPACGGRDCGDDGCGGSCGACDTGQICSDFGQCKEFCAPACSDKECGDDGCEGTCGECVDGQICEDGLCVEIPPECGDEACDASETCATCPVDCGECCGNGNCDLPLGEHCGNCTADCGECPPECGDDVCGDDEDCATCPQDCGECCGDGECEEAHDEDCATCPEDCGDCCGDGACDNIYGESCSTCPEDCGECPAECGDGLCEESETCFTCPADCGGCCGNGACDESLGETCGSCPADCGECPPECGDGLCEESETCFTCPADCGCCCGDGACEAGYDEDCSTCPADCGECPPECGDWLCEGDEDCGSCPADCPCGPDEICLEGVCCLPACSGKECGDDGCGGSCGACPADEECSAEGLCLPPPAEDCGEAWSCAMDCGMDIFCLDACKAGLSDADLDLLTDLINCVVFACWERGESGCWEEAAEVTCLEEFLACEAGPCLPDCQGKECGDDGCGGSCGVCPVGEECSPDGACAMVAPEICAGAWDCLLNCEEAECANACSAGLPPEEMALYSELLSCALAACIFVPGPDCLAQAAQTECLAEFQACVDGPCVPACSGKECGDNGCGGSCGTCPDGSECLPDGTCVEITTLTCGQIFECAILCSVWNSNCVDKCQAMGSTQAQELFGPLLLCVTMECMFPAPTEDCWLDAVAGPCGSQYQACLDDEPCIPNCAGKECGDDGCGGVCGTCPDGQECNGQDLCQPLPSIDCKGIYLCAEACGFTVECIDECKAQGSPLAVALFEELQDCVEQLCQTFPFPLPNCWQIAIQTQCGIQYEICVEDGPIPFP